MLRKNPTVRPPVSEMLLTAVALGKIPRTAGELSGEKGFGLRDHAREHCRPDTPLGPSISCVTLESSPSLMIATR
jgi:hypothetical protein